MGNQRPGELIGGFGQTKHKGHRGSDGAHYSLSRLPDTALIQNAGRSLNGVLREIAAEASKPRGDGREDHRRKPCRREGCTRPHLKGSDYCPDHDNNKRPKKRKAD